NIDAKCVLSTGEGVCDAGKPISLTLHAKQAETPLVVAAYCRGVQVGQAAVTTKKGANDLTVPVLAEASGVIRVTVYDYTQKSPAHAAADKSKPDAKTANDDHPRPIARSVAY